MNTVYDQPMLDALENDITEYAMTGQPRLSRFLFDRGWHK